MITYILWGALVTLFFDFALRNTENAMNNFERILCIVLWPLFLFMFIYWLIKNNFL